MITRSPDCLPNARINTIQRHRRKMNSCETFQRQRETHLYTYFHSRARDNLPHLLDNAPWQQHPLSTLLQSLLGPKSEKVQHGHLNAFCDLATTFWCCENLKTSAVWSMPTLDCSPSGTVSVSTQSGRFQLNSLKISKLVPTWNVVTLGTLTSNFRHVMKFAIISCCMLHYALLLLSRLMTHKLHCVNSTVAYSLWAWSTLYGTQSDYLIHS